jgi:hypothetical protein
MRNFRIRAPTEVLTGWSKKNEMGWACGTYESKTPLRMNKFKWKKDYYSFYLRRRMRDRELDWSSSRRGSVARGCGRCKEHTGSIICVEIFWLVMELSTFRGGLCSVEFVLCFYLFVCYSSVHFVRITAGGGGRNHLTGASVPCIPDTSSPYLFLWPPYCKSLSSSMAGVANKNITRVQSRGYIGEATQ